MNKITLGWILCSFLLVGVAIAADYGEVYATPSIINETAYTGRILTTTNGNFAQAGDHFIDEANSVAVAKVEYQNAVKLYRWSENRAYDIITHNFVVFPNKEKRYTFRMIDVQMVDGHYILEGFDYSKLEGINLANIHVRR